MLQFLSKSTMLLLIPGPGEGTITGKVFDYLALRKPILLLSRGNVALEGILTKTQNGLIVPYNNIEEIVHCLDPLIREFLENGALRLDVNEEEINLYTSPEMTRKLARIMDEVRSDC